MEKGLSPDMLVMTATPIPRSLSMVVFGDLDVSVIDGMPEGRQKIVTKVFNEAGREKAYKLVAEELRAGRQAFFVYPLVDESDKSELLAATKMASQLKETTFPQHRIGLLHGRMKAEEKEEIMLSFRRGGIDILVCTTVVEVGIDIPNASVMLVEHAERFGLSQLHQLRGRIGRGPHPSKCLLDCCCQADNKSETEAPDHGGDSGWLQDCGRRHGDTGSGRYVRRSASRHPEVQDRRYCAKWGHYGAGSRYG